MVFYPLSTVFYSYHGDRSHCPCLSWVSPVLGMGSDVSCLGTLPHKNPEDPRGPHDYESNTLLLNDAGPGLSMLWVVDTWVGRENYYASSKETFFFLLCTSTSILIQDN